MNVRQFDYILSVAELKSFGQAAERCNITQSTLSTMVAKFEDEIGIQVFDRSTKPFSITKEGESVIQQLGIITKEIRVLNEVAQSIKGEHVGTIRIGVIPTVAPFLLPLFLKSFTNKFPKIDFIISEMTTERIVDLLKKRELDIGILAIPLGYSSLTEIPLYNEPFVLFDCNPKQSKTLVSFEDIDFNRMWLLEEGHCLHTQVKKLCDLNNMDQKAEVNFKFKAGSIDSLIRFVRINEGMTLLPYLATLDFLESDRKKIEPFLSPTPVRTVGLLVHRHFVKKQILDVLQEDINKYIIPLLDSNTEEYVVPPI